MEFLPTETIHYDDALAIANGMVFIQPATLNQQHMEFKQWNYATRATSRRKEKD